MKPLVDMLGDAFIPLKTGVEERNQRGGQSPRLGKPLRPEPVLSALYNADKSNQRCRILAP